MVGIFPAYDSDQNFLGWEVWYGDLKLHGPCGLDEAGAFAQQFRFLLRLGVKPRLQENATGNLSATEVRDGKHYTIEFNSIDEAANYFGYIEPKIDFVSAANANDWKI